jgi:hypothetical protein
LAPKKIGRSEDEESRSCNKPEAKANFVDSLFLIAIQLISLLHIFRFDLQVMPLCEKGYLKLAHEI